MYNTNQTITPESITDTSLSAKYSHNSHHPSLFLFPSEKTSPSKNQYRTTSHQNWNDNIIHFKRDHKNDSKKSFTLLERNGYKICLANSDIQRTKANELIRHMYAARGYCTESATTLFYNPNQITLEVTIKQHIAGTLTVSHDSEFGLLADTLYKKELDTIRLKNNRKICELTKLAIDPQYSSRELIASLFNMAYINARIICKATDFVIEVNPRHAEYYKRLLGFSQIGGLRICPRVKAPAILLHLELDYVDTQVACLAGTRNRKQRSLYSYFLTKYEEGKLANKIQRQLNEQPSYDWPQVNNSCFV